MTTNKTFKAEITIFTGWGETRKVITSDTYKGLKHGVDDLFAWCERRNKEQELFAFKVAKIWYSYPSGKHFLWDAYRQ